MTTRRWKKSVALFAAAGLLVAACGGDDDADTPDTGDTAESTADDGDGGRFGGVARVGRVGIVVATAGCDQKAGCNI